MFTAFILKLMIALGFYVGNPATPALDWPPPPEGGQVETPLPPPPTEITNPFLCPTCP